MKRLPELKGDSKPERGEEELLNCLSQGETVAFWRLWTQYRSYLFGLCLQQMGGVYEDAEDALSQAMIKAFDRLPDHARRITNLKAWLTRLTRNLCVDLQRDHDRRTSAVRSLEDITVANEAALAHDFESPEEAVLRREMYACLQCAIDDLPVRLRAPLILRFFVELSYADIAEQLMLSIENVRKRTQEARAILQEKLNTYLVGGSHHTLKNPGSEEPPTINWGAPITIAGILNRDADEIKSKIGATGVVQITLPSGLERSFHIFLDQIPTRQHLKINTLSKYVQQHPQGWKKRLELADLLYAMGRWKEAIKQYHRVLERHPGLINVWLQLGNILHLMERDQEAIAVYQTTLPQTRKLSTQHHVNGLIALCRQQYEVAAQAFEGAAMREPDNAAHWHLLGLAHLHAENFHQALCALDEALKINPDDIVALTHSYDALCAVGRPEEAHRRVAHMLELVPHDVLALKRMADFRLDRGLIHGQEGKITRRLIRQALRLAPGAADIQELLSLYHSSRGEYRTSIAILDRFAQQHPNSPCGWYNYARTLFRTGDSQAAVAAIMKAYALYQKSGDIHQVRSESVPYAGRFKEPPTAVEMVL
jgi:RNA polymerase sigma factor (sigma-70 family)